MSRLVFDIETNGLLDEIHTLHLITICDADTTDPAEAYHDDPELERAGSLEDGLARLQEAEVLIGHNILGYDLPALERLTGFVQQPGTHLVDTFIASRLCYSDRRERDYQAWPKGSEHARHCGSHGLAAWGVRLGNRKGDYTGDFQQLDQDMLVYGLQDTEVTRDLFHHLEPLLPTGPKGGPTTLELEQFFSVEMEGLRDRGVRFDVDGCEELLSLLHPRRLELEDKLTSMFPAKRIPYAVNKKTGKQTRRKDAEGNWRTYKEVPFNPNSRQELANRLQSKYGWVPSKLSKNGNPSMVEDIMVELGGVYEEAKLAAELYIVNARIGILERGRGSYLNYVTDEGRIHARTNHIGTITHRCSHTSPNLGNPTSVQKPWGKEIRGLFLPNKDMIMVGGDASGLEQRVLAHYLAKWDGGKYAETVDQGDIHSLYMNILHSIRIKVSRAETKTIEYAWMYGAGDAHLGKLCGGTYKTGKKVRNAFQRQIQGLDRLIKGLDHFRVKQGYVRSLDGRRVSIRHQHAQLNTLLQSAGAVVMKWQLFYLKEECQKKDIKWLEDYIPHLHVHDEVQGSLKPDRLEDFTEAFEASFQRTEEHLGLRVPLRCDVKHGASWLDTH